MEFTVERSHGDLSAARNVDSSLLHVSGWICVCACLVYGRGCGKLSLAQLIRFFVVKLILLDKFST